MKKIILPPFYIITNILLIAFMLIFLLFQYVIYFIWHGEKFKKSDEYDMSFNDLIYIVKNINIYKTSYLNESIPLNLD